MQSSPKTSTYYLCQAMALALAGRLEEARYPLKRGLELEPGFRLRWIYGIATQELADKFTEGARLLALPE